jgi:ABC-type Fe3+-hydroxamate transport system substrate-binding protein
MKKLIIIASLLTLPLTACGSTSTSVNDLKSSIAPTVAVTTATPVSTTNVTPTPTPTPTLTPTPEPTLVNEKISKTYVMNKN